MQSILKTAAIAAIASLGLAASSNAAVVINELYGAGGNSGASLNQDYIELYNNGGPTVDLSTLQLEYASSGGTFNGSTSTFALPSFNLASGGFYLVGGASGTNGTAIPTPDATSSINLSGTNGKIRLVPFGNADTSKTIAGTVDYVGFGSADTFEGTAAAPSPSSTMSISRTVLGVDTNNNGADFSVTAPSPTNSGSTVPEPTSLAIIGLAGLGALRRRRA